MNQQEANDRLRQQEATLGKIDLQLQRLDEELDALEATMTDAGLLEDGPAQPTAKLRRRRPR